MPQVLNEKILYTFQLMSGEHQGKKRGYVKGDLIRITERLDLKFPNKFQLMPHTSAHLEDLDDEISAKHIAIVQNNAVSPPETPPGLRDDPLPVPQGPVKDMMPFDFASAAVVTHLFPLAADCKCEVYKDSLDGYAVAESGTTLLTNLAGSILGSKKQVNQFLVSLMPNNDETDDSIE